ncbi:hypothetical protein OXT66_05645 [Lentilactobacillus senioris]|uniref:phage neck terminator protein n=1 Tax=Lentilactobacillus senioris TaxID=931534 RepID=UPI00227F6CDB|nr:hypothetical protein [Lentilactobacillus senioris]MCY9807033.1 hypothetical protein [Lentilactobacillus senioris]
MNRPFDKQPTDYDSVIGSLVTEIEKIADCPVIPNEQIAKAKEFPFISYYPLMYDDPVYSDPNINSGQFEAIISIDVFCKTLSEVMQKAGALHVFLRDPYVRQELRNNGIVIASAESPKGRAVNDLPFNSVHHHGFDVTIRYTRHFQSPIDQISNADITTNFKEEF